MSFARKISSSTSSSAGRARYKERCDDSDVVAPNAPMFSNANGSTVVADVMPRSRRKPCGVPKELLFTVGVLTTALQGGGLIFGFSAFADQVTKLQNSPFTTSDVSSIFSIGHNITAWGCILSGFLLDKLGPRACAVSGLIVEALGHYLMMKIETVPKLLTYVGYGLIGLGGCQVLLAALSFTDAFKNSGLTSSILTAAFQSGGFIFMVLQFVDFSTFFALYLIFCIVSAVVLVFVYPSSPLPAYNAGRDTDEHSDVAELTAALVRQKTLKQILRLPGTLGFMFTFMVAGSALTYGIGEFVAAVKDKDQCVWDADKGDYTVCEHKALQDLYNNVMMPLVGNFILPVSLALGRIIDKAGFALPAFINIFFVQVFMVSLWLFPLDAQFGTLIIYNVANTAVFTVQNAYICAIGHDHMGALFGISNAVLGVGNLLADWLTLNPLGSAQHAIHESIAVSCVTWLVACTPLYYWVVVEVKRSKRQRAGIASIAGSTRSCDSRLDVRPLLSGPSNEVHMSSSVMSTFSADKDHAVLTINPEIWDVKVEKALSAGADSMFWVCDFDRTVTRCFLDNGCRSLDCHDILASIPKITPECKQEMEDMMDHYYPIEIHPTMSREEKIPHMVEWYSRVNRLLATQKITQDDVILAVANCQNFRIRHGVEEAFGLAHQKGIPIIIVSAGLGNIIEEVVKQRIHMPDVKEGKPWPNIRVLSNTLQWDDHGDHIGYSEPLIHMYNKTLQDAPADIRQLLKDRHVGILTGDSTGDLTMAHGHHAEPVLKFGFLNEKIEERMAKYIGPDCYDRVILNDGSFESVLQILRQL